MKPTRTLAAATLLALAALPVQAGPWATGKGKSYAKLGYGYLRSTTLYTPDGTRFEIPRFVKQDVNLYAAYGVSDRVTAILSAPLLLSSDLEDFQQESSIGDLKAGLQVQLGKSGPWVFAARGLVQFPTGDETLADGLLPTGSGAWEGQAVAGVGRSLAGGKGWSFVEAGHQLRRDLRDAFLYGGQLGWHVSPRLALAANVRGVEQYDLSPREARGSFSGLSDPVTYTTYGPSAMFKLAPSWVIQLDLEDTFREHNLATGLTWRIGLAHSR